MLVQYETVFKDEHDIDGTDIAKWSIYHLNDISEDEEHITPADEFQKMLDSEGWKQVGHETAIVR
jgi:hypothetical protein